MSCHELDNLVPIERASTLGRKRHWTGDVVLHEVPDVYENAVNMERVEAEYDIRQSVERVRQELANGH